MTDSALQENISSPVGQILKEARLLRGVTLEEVAKKLCITKRQLVNLEEGEEPLVWDVYKLGFVKLYAQYLELDTQDIIKKFKDQASHKVKSPPLVFPAPLPGRGMPSFRILGLSFLILLAIFIGWKWMSNHTVAPYPHPEVGTESAHAEETVLPSVSIRKEKVAEEPNASFNRIFQSEGESPEILLPPDSAKLLEPQRETH